MGGRTPLRKETPVREGLGGHCLHSRWPLEGRRGRRARQPQRVWHEWGGAPSLPRSLSPLPHSPTFPSSPLASGLPVSVSVKKESWGMPRVTENSLNASISSWGRWGVLPGTDKRGTTLVFPPYGIPPMLNGASIFNSRLPLHTCDGQGWRLAFWGSGRQPPPPPKQPGAAQLLGEADPTQPLAERPGIVSLSLGWPLPPWLWPPTPPVENQSKQEDCGRSLPLPFSPTHLGPPPPACHSQVGSCGGGPG